MKQVKIFMDVNTEVLETSINDWIKSNPDAKILDIETKPDIDGCITITIIYEMKKRSRSKSI